MSYALNRTGCSVLKPGSSGEHRAAEIWPVWPREPRVLRPGARGMSFTCLSVPRERDFWVASILGWFLPKTCVHICTQGSCDGLHCHLVSRWGWGKVAHMFTLIRDSHLLSRGAVPFVTPLATQDRPRCSEVLPAFRIAGFHNSTKRTRCCLVILICIFSGD